MTNMKRTRKAMTIAITVFACAVFTACASEGSDGAVQPKEIVATKAVVTTTAETEATTTTTTESVTDSEPEAKKTTTEAITTSEPETTTEPEVTTTEVTTPEKDELLSVEECLEKIVSNTVGEEVKITNIDCDEISNRMTVYFDNDMVVGTYNVISHYIAGDKTNIDLYVVDRVPSFDYAITYYG